MNYPKKERFYKFIEPMMDDRGCWEWTGSINIGGYGSIRHNKRLYPAHRFGYELLIGPIPLGLHCLHKCDNRSCVNPNHLFLGTNYDNVLDKMSKNRAGRGVPKTYNLGLNNCNNTLTEAQVRYIREKVKTQRAYAEELGVSRITIQQIQKGATWKHLLETCTY